VDSLYRGSVAKRPDVAIDEEPDAVCHVADAAVAGHRVLLAAAVFLAAAAAAVAGHRVLLAAAVFLAAAAAAAAAVAGHRVLLAAAVFLAAAAAAAAAADLAECFQGRAWAAA